MKEFEFYNPVRIFFGKGQVSQITAQIPSGSRVMIIYGGGSIFKNGVYYSVREALSQFETSEFGGIEPNPSYETCMSAVEKIRKEKSSFLLAVGGGSVIDAVKFISAAVPFKDGDPWTILTSRAQFTETVPFGAVLTLPATGTEMNANSVISKKSTTEKLAFSSPLVFPEFSVLLPDAAGTLPQKQVANGVVDAFVHIIEQYLTYPVNSPVQDRMAEALLITLVEEGPKVFANPSDYDSMSNLMWSATMALNGLLSAGVPGDWSVHTIGHELTAFHGIDHARTLAIVLPGVWKALKEEKREKLLQYGERVWKIAGGNDDDRIDKTIKKTEEFFLSLGVPVTLSAYGVGSGTIELIASRFEERGWKTFGDRSLVTPALVREILTKQL